MDRPISYIGAVPRINDFLNTNRNAMIGLGCLAKAILGTSTLFEGLACTPTTPGSLQVLVAPGSVYAFGNVDGTAYGNLSSDTTHQIVKQGIVLDTTTLNCPAPSTTGNSINYLIQAAFQDQDTDSVVLPYFNATNPAVAYNGPNNTGVSQNTTRKGACVISVKAGVSAATGTQVTPSPDAGFTGLWVVSVHNGQTAIASGDITQAAGAPLISETLTQKISLATGDARYLRFGNVPFKLSANLDIYVSPSGNDTTGDGTNGNPWQTLQKAVTFLQQSIDTGGYSVTVHAAAGTYSAGVLMSGALRGGGSLTFLGDPGTPSNVVVAVSSGTNFQALNGAVFGVSGFKLTNSGTGGSCLNAAYGSTIYFQNIDFGTATNATHIVAGEFGAVLATGNYSISGAATTHLSATQCGSLDIGGKTVTLTGTPAFSNSFVAATYGGSSIYAPGVTFSGSATGVRYSAVLNGVIQTSGGGANYFPGSSAGSVSLGAQYA